jgi:serine/threonine protein phosphatase PrpC
MRMMQTLNPKTHLRFETGAATHVGMVRKQNEDSYIVHEAAGLWAVADGVGGHEAGDLASQTVAQKLGSIGLPISAADLFARFEERIVRANDAVNEIARKRGGIVGTTVAALLIHAPSYACVWSGDSRVYMLRNGALQQLSRDHTEVQELIDRGVITRAEAQTWPRRNVITRAIGIGEDPELEIEHGKIELNDIFLLCSDGLTGHISDDEIRQYLADLQAPQNTCDALIKATLDRGATDNVTVIVVRCVEAPPETAAVRETTVRGRL